jgi:hypothetical protein
MMLAWILRHMPTETHEAPPAAIDLLERCIEAPACLQVDELQRMGELSGPIDETGEVLA